MNRIRMFDYLEQYRRLQDEMRAALERVLASGQLILGPEGQRFEQAFAAFLGGGGTCVAVNSGTDALAIGLRALGVGPGDEVVTVANTAVPTVSAVRMAGATPVFVDVDADTALMDLDEVPRRLTPRTKAVIPVHLYGNVVDVPRLAGLLAGRGIAILEDCAQAHGATLGGRPAGTMGAVGAFSFYPTKNLGAYGDGGLCFSADPELVRKMRRIRMYGFDGRYYAEMEGVNSRLDELQAAVLNVKLPHLADWVERRRALAALYDRLLPAAVRPLRPAAGVAHAYHLYVVRVPDRDRVRMALAERGIDTSIHYPFPIHLMRGYAFLGYAAGSLPVTEALATQVLSLPLYPELPDDAVRQVCRALREVTARP
jgi:dTDP-4-amino-4,6-dideoxygalactose transaminase